MASTVERYVAGLSTWWRQNLVSCDFSSILCSSVNIRRMSLCNSNLQLGQLSQANRAAAYIRSATKNSSGDEIANVNFLYDDIVNALQNTIDSCIHSASATDRRGYVSEHRFTKFSEITQCSGHYAVQGHSRSPILVPIESGAHIRLPISD